MLAGPRTDRIDSGVSISAGANRTPGNGYQARWERHNTGRQTRILEAAVELLEDGQTGAEISVQQIAQRAGLAKSVVYRQFRDREDLDRRVRSYLVDEFAGTLATKLDISDGSLEEILVRSINTVAEWMSDHPRLHEFVRSGPTHYDDTGIDAVSSLKAAIAGRARDIIAGVSKSIDVDDSAFESLALALVTMVEGTLAHWVRGQDPELTRAKIVDDLATYAWYVLDGAARTLGVHIDPQAKLVTVINQLTVTTPPAAAADPATRTVQPARPPAPSVRPR